MTDVEKFIINFKQRFKDSEDLIVHMFTNGLCYHFTSILKDVFPGGIVIHDEIANHFLYWYDGYYYDITGAIELDMYKFAGFVEWEETKEEYQRLTHVYDNHYDVVRRCCVLLEE
jgi:hypothetical protein